MPINAVAFDLGGVMFEWGPHFLYEKLIPDAAERERFIARIFNRAVIQRLDAYDTLSEGLAALSRVLPEDAHLIDQYLPRFGDTFGPPFEGSVKILEELRGLDIPVFALSNWYADTWHFGEAKYSFLSLFDGLFISGFEGVAKPDPAFYLSAAQKFNFSPKTTFFVDDHRPNVDAAAELGFHAVLFENAEDLRNDMIAAGLPLKRP
ncbi:MAG: HAD family phosphatase [Proteobacteria bacterium]|nr:HAD family phosphatase [Pseudomonadota bacterium]